MKNLKKCIVLFLCILLITGCSNKKGTDGKGINNTNSVDKVIDNQIANEDRKNEITESEEASFNVESSKDTEDTISRAEDVSNTDGTVDYDLMQMSSDMVYATACCAQGIEFVWEDGSHIYPDEYPTDNAEIIVEGTFETYKEERDENMYCRLSDATLQKKN